MAVHPSILAWRVPWTEEPAGLQATGSHRPDGTKQLILSLVFLDLNKKFTQICFLSNFNSIV